MYAHDSSLHEVSLPVIEYRMKRSLFMQIW